MNLNGSFTYAVPGATFSGTDMFKYVISNSAGTATGTATIIVGVAPAAVNDSYVSIGSVLSVGSAQGVLPNDSRPNGAAIVSYGEPDGTATTAIGTATTTAKNGLVILRSDGSFDYDSRGSFATDMFHYIIANSIA